MKKCDTDMKRGFKRGSETEKGALLFLGRPRISFESTDGISAVLNLCLDEDGITRQYESRKKYTSRGAFKGTSLCSVHPRGPRWGVRVSPCGKQRAVFF